LDRRLGGPQSLSGRLGEEKILDPTGTRIPNKTGKEEIKINATNQANKPNP
jgi:hypothetical protein